jgi:hypothetical protein
MYVGIVSELLNDVQSKISGNIADLWDLAVESPADLVGTFEVIEMYQVL